ncbi:hypothetical protein KDL01_01245 [Actinospica durhamensis]|uniref:Uncharacterized protein n=1 Tax=Actinospica durhamensis TaxID=1508375 RepID=A0A941EMQ9_9ACTN|nr:hypothetical protein [Actinospica durhamensis]MBR7831864.1 hypothetical protein [Actinospica durhamensis]
MSSSVGFNGGGPVSCSALPSGRWLVTGEPESTATTQVERYGAYYVALTVDSQSLQPISPARLPALLASVHHADDADLAADRMDTSTLLSVL